MKRIFFLIVITVTAFSLYWGQIQNNRTNLAQCLTDKGAVLYITTWCHFCEIHIKKFGHTAKNLKIIQCDDPNKSEDYYNPECFHKGIEGFPVWVFSDKSLLTGNHSLKTIAKKAGCPSP